MHNLFVFLLIRVFLLQKVQCQDTRYDEKESNDCVENPKESFKTAVVAVEHDKALVVLKIHL